MIESLLTLFVLLGFGAIIGLVAVFAVLYISWEKD
jgi:hypothetical protein